MGWLSLILNLFLTLNPHLDCYNAGLALDFRAGTGRDSYSAESSLEGSGMRCRQQQSWHTRTSLENVLFVSLGTLRPVCLFGPLPGPSV